MEMRSSLERSSSPAHMEQRTLPMIVRDKVLEPMHSQGRPSSTPPGARSETPDAFAANLFASRPGAKSIKTPNRVQGAEPRLTHDVWELLQCKLKHQFTYWFESRREGLNDSSSREAIERNLGYDAEARIPTLDALQVKTMACSGQHAAVVSAEGTLYMWGDNSKSQLGFNTFPYAQDDNRVMVFHPTPTATSAFDIRGGMTVLATTKGNKSLDNGPPLAYPRPAPHFCEMKISHIACGDGFTLAVVDKKNMYSWGDNASGQLGFEDTRHRPSPSSPTQLRGLNFTYVSAGKAHSGACITQHAHQGGGGEVLMWGMGSQGQLGHALVHVRAAPKAVRSLHTHHIVKVACGYQHSVFLTMDGRVFTCGKAGSHGHPEHTGDLLKPLELEGFATGSAGRDPSRKLPIIIKDVCAGYGTSLALDDQGVAYAWGNHPTLSQPDPVERERGMPLSLTWIDQSVTAISVGENHAAVLLESGVIRAWGTHGVSLLDSPALSTVPEHHHRRIPGWDHTVYLDVALPKQSDVLEFCCYGGASLILCKPIPFFPSGEILTRALYSLFDWWGALTESQRVDPKTGQLQISRSGWTVFGRAMGLINNSTLYSEWQTYFDQDRVVQGEDPGQLSPTTKNHMTVDTFLKSMTRIAEERHPPPPERQIRAPTVKKKKPQTAVTRTSQKQGMDVLSRLTASPQGRRPSTADGSVDSRGRPKKKQEPKQRPWGAAEPPKKIVREKKKEKVKGLQNIVDPTIALWEKVWNPGTLYSLRLLFLERLPLMQVRVAKDPPPLVLRELMSHSVMGFFEGPHLEMMLKVFSHLAWDADYLDSDESSVLELISTLKERDSTGQNALVNLDRLVDWVIEIGLIPSDMPERAAREGVNGALGARWREQQATLSFPETMETLAACALLGVFPHSVAARMAVKEGVTAEMVAQSVSADVKMTAMLNKIQRWRDRSSDPAKYATRVRDTEELEEEVARVFALFCSPPLTLMTRTHFRKLIRAARLPDNRVWVTHLDALFQALVKDQEQHAAALEREREEGLSRSRRERKVGLPKFGKDRPPTPQEATPDVEPGLDFAVFRQAIGMIAALKHPDLDTPSAFRNVVEKNFIPFQESTLFIKDDQMEQLLETGIVSVLTRYQAPLQRMFRAYCGLDSKLGYTNTLATWEVLERSNCTIPFAELLKIAQDKHIIPELVSRAELEAVFVRAVPGVQKGSHSSFFPELNYSEYVDVLGLLGLVVFSHPERREDYPTPADKMEALFRHMKLKVTRAKSGKGGNAEDDPYKEWFQMKFVTNEVNVQRAWYWGSSDDFPPALIRDVVKPPACPSPDVSAVLALASQSAQAGNLIHARSLFHEAHEAWNQLCEEEGRDLAPEHNLFFACSMGAVLEGLGDDSQALLLYRSVLSESEKLDEGHPDAALVHACLGAVYFHKGEYELAFRACVRTKVLREASPALGLKHPDTAAANNNLACCLERLGQTGKANELLRRAYSVLKHVLGADHPRTAAVTRNIARVQGKSLQISIPKHITKLAEDPKTKDPHETVACYEAVKAEMYGKARDAALEEQNEALIRFFYTPVSMTDPAEIAKQNDAMRRKRNAGLRLRRLFDEKQQEPYDAQKETHALYTKIKPAGLNNVRF